MYKESEELPCELHEDFGDVEAMLNIRDWLEAALEAKGAEITGGGIGMGQSDVDFVLEGMRFNVRVIPRKGTIHIDEEGDDLPEDCPIQPGDW